MLSLILATRSPSRGGASPIYHPRDHPQSFEATKNTTERTRFGIPVFFMSKEENSTLKAIKWKVSQNLIPVIHLQWCITHLLLQGPPLKPQSTQKYHWDNQLWLSWLFHELRGDQPPLNYLMWSLSDLFFPVTLLGFRITHLSPKGSPSEPQSNQK